MARSLANKHTTELEQYQKNNDDTQKKLNELQEKHKNVINAFEHSFDSAKFIAENKKYFQNLTLSKVEKKDKTASFDLYEVNATSKIDSPAVFYDFLDSLKKGNWVIGVNFPIHFQKEGEFIVSSFTMRVYTLNNEQQEAAKQIKKEDTDGWHHSDGSEEKQPQQQKAEEKTPSKEE